MTIHRAPELSIVSKWADIQMAYQAAHALKTLHARRIFKTSTGNCIRSLQTRRHMENLKFSNRRLITEFERQCKVADDCLNPKKPKFS